MRAVLNAVVLAAVCLPLAACGESETYPIAAPQVRSALMAARPPRMIFAGGNLVVTPTGDNDVRYTVMSPQGRALMSFIANIQAEGDSETTVWVTAEPAKGNSTAAQGMDENPAIVKLYTKAMRETIDAKLEKREFDMAAIQSEMMAASLATIPKIQNEAMKRASEFKEMESQMRDYQADGSRPGQPVNDLDRYN